MFCFSRSFDIRNKLHMHACVMGAKPHEAGAAPIMWVKLQTGSRDGGSICLCVLNHVTEFQSNIGRFGVNMACSSVGLCGVKLELVSMHEARRVSGSGFVGVDTKDCCTKTICGSCGNDEKCWIAVYLKVVGLWLDCSSFLTWVLS